MLEKLVTEQSLCAQEHHLIDCLTLIAAQGAKGEAALTTLYELTVGRVYGMALRVVRDTATAQDVTEAVFWQVWNSAAHYDRARGHPLAWLAMMARTRALDALRAREPAQTHPEPHSLGEAALDERDPQHLLLSIEAGSFLREAITQLPPIQRQLLALAFYRDMSHSEIASHMHLPLGTVKTHLRRALMRLKKSVQSASTPASTTLCAK